MHVTADTHGTSTRQSLWLKQRRLEKAEGRTIWLPDWLLYHPKLDIWYPYSLVFSQEGKTKDGQNAGFSNEPVSLDYYYHHYKNKKYNPNNISE